MPIDSSYFTYRIEVQIGSFKASPSHTQVGGSNIYYPVTRGQTQIKTTSIRKKREMKNKYKARIKPTHYALFFLVLAINGFCMYHDLRYLLWTMIICLLCLTCWRLCCALPVMNYNKCFPTCYELFLTLCDYLL